MKKVLVVLLLIVAGFAVRSAPLLADGTQPTTPPIVKAFTGKITAYDAQTCNITLTNRLRESRSFTLPISIKVQINGKPATLADITTAMYGGVIFGADGTTPVELRAYLPKTTTS
jgi:hypothetical protein